MDYTTSLDNVVHGTTGHRMHSDSIAIPTVFSANDANMVIWSLMEVLRLANLAGQPFNPDDAASYTRFRDALTTVFAKLDSPTFVGVPKAPKAPQFDNSPQVASTSFVRSVGMQASAFTSVVGATTLTEAAAGSTIYLGGTGNYPVTLPRAATVPPGGRIEFISGVGSAPVTITRQGTDVIYMNAGTSLATVPMVLGDTYVLESNGTNWYSAGGSTPLGYTGGFGALLAPVGYQKLPSGLIYQWGSVTTSANGFVPVNYPLAFQDGVYQLTTGLQNSAATSPVSALYHNVGTPKTSFNMCTVVGSGSFTPYAVSWTAIGK